MAGRRQPRWGAEGFLRARGWGHPEPVGPRSSGVSAGARMSPATFRRFFFLPLFNAQGVEDFCYLFPLICLFEAYTYLSII